MRKIIALVVALTMIFSITAVSASACFTNTTARTNRAASNLAAPKMTSLIPTLDFASILANVQKGIQGTGLVYGRDYKIEVENDNTFGYRIHLIQPVSGNTLYDNYLLYKDGKWTWEKEWNLPTIPTVDQFNLENIMNNIYTALWDSGIYVDINQDVSVTRDAQDGFKVLIVDPITGKTIFDKQFVIDSSVTIDWSAEFEPISEDCIIAAHFPTTDEATDEMIDEGESQVDDPVETEADPTDDTTDEVVVIDDSTPLAAAPAADEETIANTGDAAFSAMAVVALVAGAAFVVSKKF